MIDRVRNRLDAFSLALGGVSAKSAYSVVPIVASDRINAAWDEKLREGSADRDPDVAPDSACTGWAT